MASGATPSDSRACPSSASGTSSFSKDSLQAAYMIGRKNHNELTPQMLQTAGWPSDSILVAFKALAERRLCALRRSSPKSSSSSSGVWCMIRDEGVAQKLQAIDASEYRVFCSIEEAGNRGIWTADIRKATGMQAQSVQRAIKTLLEVKKLIKAVKNIHVKNRKVYMLADLEPSTEVAGGAFYVDGEFDEGLVERLREQIAHLLKNGQSASITEIGSYVRSAGFGQDLAADDLRRVIKTLEMEQKVQCTVSPTTGHPVFSWSRWPSLESPSAVPCGTCPVFHECHLSKKSPISPGNCQYISQWLGYNFEVGDEDAKSQPVEEAF